MKAKAGLDGAMVLLTTRSASYLSVKFGGPKRITMVQD
jgi:hypothetical protein